jgi:hypothetical protein
LLLNPDSCRQQNRDFFLNKVKRIERKFRDLLKYLSNNSLNDYGQPQPTTISQPETERSKGPIAVPAYYRPESHPLDVAEHTTHLPNVEFSDAANSRNHGYEPDRPLYLCLPAIPPRPPMSILTRLPTAPAAATSRTYTETSNPSTTNILKAFEVSETLRTTTSIPINTQPTATFAEEKEPVRTSISPLRSISPPSRAILGFNNLTTSTIPTTYPISPLNINSWTYYADDIVNSAQTFLQDYPYFSAIYSATDSERPPPNNFIYLILKLRP